MAGAVNAARQQSPARVRPFVVRPMEERHLRQVSEVEKDAFPTQFPSTSFRRELRNKTAQYLVAARSDVHGRPSPDLPPLPDYPVESPNGPFLNRLARSARGVWRRHADTWRPGEELVTGFVGLWYIADEVHIVSIGVRSEYRGLGLGEMLLISAIEQARQMRSEVMTLEVRISNHVAQNLYKKYGFTKQGVRKRYYSDNREDALIMTTTPLHTEEYARRFRSLSIEYERRWGGFVRRTPNRSQI